MAYFIIINFYIILVCTGFGGKADDRRRTNLLPAMYIEGDAGAHAKIQ